MDNWFVVRDGFGVSGQNASFRVVGPGCKETKPCITETCDSIVTGPFTSLDDAIASRDELHRRHCDGSYWDGRMSTPCRHISHG